MNKLDYICGFFIFLIIIFSRIFVILFAFPFIFIQGVIQKDIIGRFKDFILIDYL